MDKLKYFTIAIIIYIIFRIIYNLGNKNESETYNQITDNLKIIYENLLGVSAPSPTIISSSSGQIPFSPSLSKMISSYKTYLNSPSRTINIAVTLPSGVVTTVPCIGNCTNCVVTSLTPSGCYVSEKK